MAVTKRMRKYIVSRYDDMAGTMTHMMNHGDFPGRSGHGTKMNPNERIVSAHYVDGDWFVFTEEITMGPTP